MRWIMPIILICMVATFVVAVPITPARTKVDAPAITVTTSTADGLSLIIKDDIAKHETSPGKWFLNPAHGTMRLDQAGNKSPAQIIWIAVPPGKRLQIISANPNTIESVNGSFMTVKQEQPVSDGVQHYSNWIDLGTPSPLLGHTVQPVVVYLAVPNDKSITIAKSITVALRFVDDPAIASSDRYCYAPLPDYVINRNVANRWRTIHTKVTPRINSLNTLPTAPLYRIVTNTEAITVITGDELQRAGVNLTSIDPTALKLYGNSSKPLNESLTAVEPSAWNELPVIVETAMNGQFGTNDRILFYGETSAGWTPNYYDHHWLSPYTRNTTFFLDLNLGGTPGRRMTQLANDPNVGLLPRAVGRTFIENELSIYANSSFVGSGIQWVGQLFSGNTEQTYTLPLTGAVNGGSIDLYTRWVTVDGRINAPINFILNGTPLDTSFDYSLIHVTANSSLVHEGNNQFTIHKTSDISYYLDWIEALYPRDWNMRNGKLTAEAAIASSYRVNLVDGVNPYIFEVSDRNNIRYRRGTSFSDSGSTTTYRRYLAAEENVLTHTVSITPVTLGGDEYTDLRDPSLQSDYLIIYDDKYHSQALRLKTQRESYNHVSVKMIRIRDIYDQFSGGNLDPTSIRNFLRYTLQSWQRPAPKYVMLFGDGDYDYRGLIQPNTERPIPPHESGGTCNDDFYVQLSASNTSTFDMVCARLPLQSPALMDVWLDKLIDYETHPVVGSWRNKIVLCADDEYHEGGEFASWEETHTIKSEDLDHNKIPPTYERVKIYLIEYQGSYDPTQSSIVKPDANIALMTELQRGALMVNWIGHGNPRIWAHEQLLRESRDLDHINTGMKIPIWIAFTCDWGYWDDPAIQSMPEALLGLPENGAIAAVAATRLTGADPNEELADQYFLAQLDTTRHPAMSVAEALSYGKALTGIHNTNSNYYHAMCDPLFTLALPQIGVTIDSIRPEPLVPLSRANTYGRIHAPRTNLDGTVTAEVRGSPVTRVHYWDNDPTQPYYYTKPGLLLFRGLSSIHDTSYSAPMMLPIDATYGDSNGSIQAFAEGSWGISVGLMKNVRIAYQPNTVIDTIPPTIKLYMNSRGFRDGDIVNDSPTLIADVADSSGVNLTGEVGHRIIATIDGHDYDFTEQFSYLNDDVTHGVLQTPVGYLDPGKHHLRLIVFDGANNPGTAEADFQVASATSEAALRNLLNYPNPIKGNTQFTFECTIPGTGTVDIYTVHGTKIKSVGPFAVSVGYNYNPDANWDARDKDGVDVANGVYLWRLKVRADNGTSVETTGRAAVLR